MIATTAADVALELVRDAAPILLATATLIVVVRGRGAARNAHENLARVAQATHEAVVAIAPPALELPSVPSSPADVEKPPPIVDNAPAGG